MNHFSIYRKFCLTFSLSAEHNQLVTTFLLVLLAHWSVKRYFLILSWKKNFLLEVDIIYILSGYAGNPTVCWGELLVTEQSLQLCQPQQCPQRVLSLQHWWVFSFVSHNNVLNVSYPCNTGESSALSTTTMPSTCPIPATLVSLQLCQPQQCPQCVLSLQHRWVMHADAYYHVYRTDFK